MGHGSEVTKSTTWVRVWWRGGGEWARHHTATMKENDYVDWEFAVQEWWEKVFGNWYGIFFFLNLMVSLTVQLNGLAHQNFAQSKYYTNGID